MVFIKYAEDSLWQRLAEIRHAEKSLHVTLAKAKHDDPFHAVARALAPALGPKASLTHRDLAMVTTHQATAQGTLPLETLKKT